ncbi:hypothetical protein ELQ92_06060 [Labedella populi]|uniref:Uncharacterized protein n=1 Tax=Labedella populi TaxID=2498850 RepID=A0A3S3ZWC9_9MICO|nr:hypothetical protein [Labedella populi]RWZ64330.1 hypothetical protein ELQ92_06060 [Labedella populi]
MIRPTRQRRRPRLRAAGGALVIAIAGLGILSGCTFSGGLNGSYGTTSTVNYTYDTPVAVP